MSPSVHGTGEDICGKSKAACGAGDRPASALGGGPLSDRPEHSDGDAPPTTNPYRQKNIKQTSKTLPLSSAKSTTLLIRAHVSVLLKLLFSSVITI
ncbi:hypothetical protein MUK42_18573 [Musa troglodytarum]|uniref:Uncharacterized protein n=1 Tax=Musa troglodytarum TaxID=320322 RepID=A0A9E7EVF9_9LILI|nr:hypothetical protein MUK42_18573 [Musa troglodytarum]